MKKTQSVQNQVLQKNLNKTTNKQNLRVRFRPKVKNLSKMSNRKNLIKMSNRKNMSKMSNRKNLKVKISLDKQKALMI